MKDAFTAIKQLLDNHKIKFKVMEHEPAITSEDAARIRGTTREQGAKAILLRSEGRFYMFVLSGIDRIDMKKVRQMLDTDSLTMATPEEVKQVIGCEVGGVPPFGSIFKIKCFVDRGLLKNEEIAFNAGLRTKSIIMKRDDWLKVEKPYVEDFRQ